MNLHHLLNARLAAGKPVRVALIGAGKFGSMFLSQVPHTPGLEVPVIIDLDRDRAREACRTVGWDAERIARTAFTDDGVRAMEDARVRTLPERGVKLFVCAYGCQKRRIPLDDPDLVTYCGLVVLTDVINATDRFIALN